MDPESVLSQIASLELQLAMMKAQLKQAGGAKASDAAARLYGICAGRSETTEEDLAAAKYRLKEAEPKNEDESA